MKPTRHILANQKGAYFLMSAIVLSVMVGFAALGVEIGRWYDIQAEISKSIDGAAFAGAKNVNNPLFPNAAALQDFVEQVANANFPPGLLGTDTPTFTANLDAQGKVTVNGNVHSLNSMSTVFDTGATMTALDAVGSAKLRKAEVVLVLDVSGSMGGAPIADLIDGATTFVHNFESFQQNHKFALLTFGSGVETPYPLATNFVDPMTFAISGLAASGFTNTEDALTQALNIGWEPGQLALPGNERTRQAVILFSDGNPTAFRGTFGYDGNQNMDAVGILNGGTTVVAGYLGDPNVTEYSWLTTTWPGRHGDGKTAGSSACAPISGDDRTTKWYIFQDPTYGINAYGSPMNSYSFEDCNINQADWDAYMTWLTRQMAIDQATNIKALGIEIYTIGLGNIDQGFLTTLATDTDHTFFANDSSELTGIFQEIANKLKIILVS